jgi:hypothetical protein
MFCTGVLESYCTVVGAIYRFALPDISIERRHGVGAALGTALLLCVGGAVAVPAPASAEHPPPGEVRVSLHDTSGVEVAVARLSSVAEGTRVRVSARRLPPV